MGADLYLPSPFARGCKVTLDRLPFYYSINYRKYDPGTNVKSFTMCEMTEVLTHPGHVECVTCGHEW